MITKDYNTGLGVVGIKVFIFLDGLDTHGRKSFGSALGTKSFVGGIVDFFIGSEALETINFFFVAVKPYEAIWIGGTETV